MTIPIEDLLVSVVGKRVRLRSERLGREVIPRLTAAHRYVGGRIGLYQFLCTLQAQGVMAGMQWSWGPLAFSPRLPRVTMGRLVLARATWRLDETDIRSLTSESGPASFRGVQELRRERLMPRIVEIVDGDNTLPIDLDNAACVDVLVDLLRNRPHATLREMFPSPEELPVTGPEGAFVHEIIVPFVSPAPKRRHGSRHGTRHETATRPPALRSFSPGSEWLYAKLYTGTATADRLLKSVVRPVVSDAMRSGASDGWFFIRYSDPHWHLRVRFHGEAARLLDEVLPNLHERAETARRAGSFGASSSTRTSERSSATAERRSSSRPKRSSMRIPTPCWTCWTF